jgi:hypothetical protein
MKGDRVPLLDHFHPPLSASRHWESFHAAWATELMAVLNRDVLPPGYFAETQVHLGSRVEIDVASFEQGPARAPDGDGGAVAVEAWAPPVATFVMPAVFPDEIEVQVFASTSGPTLVAAIELISPGNKDRADARRAFAAKCAAYLQMGIGLVIVDIVTHRQANLHDEMIGLLERPDAFRFTGGTPLYAVAYRPVRRESEGDGIETWPMPLAVGDPLPTMPLALRGAATVPLDLEASYSEARHRGRL